jgi:putative transcriptional regulator
MSLRGRLLVAEPTLGDPNFHRTVVYLIEHSEAGALGLVLNRPGDVLVREAIPAWAPYLDDDSPVYVGGPVSPEGAICLARCPSEGPRESLFEHGDDDEEEPVDPTAIFKPITPSIGALDLHGDPSDAPAGIQALRVFAGYAGWSGGQLELEMEAGGWYVVDAEDTDVFTDRPEVLWRDVLRRQRTSLRAIAFYPEDPTLN